MTGFDVTAAELADTARRVEAAASSIDAESRRATATEVAPTGFGGEKYAGHGQAYLAAVRGELASVLRGFHDVTASFGRSLGEAANEYGRNEADSTERISGLDSRGS
ncbi:hypothetical protein [Amycolatopsis anabasis]|uniref:hypothetical protein n=1 Tax=Amycolatopsis anabasis TaxID=1840409 RepID=UPI00131E3547|nr:hypothetical protein [Amycolatopsis anabasis]